MDKAEVLRYMREESHEHVDPRAGEFNCTMMAEDAAMNFDLYGPPPRHKIPEWAFELAFEVSEELRVIVEFNGMCKQRR